VWKCRAARPKPAYAGWVQMSEHFCPKLGNLHLSDLLCGCIVISLLG